MPRSPDSAPMEEDGAAAAYRGRTRSHGRAAENAPRERHDGPARESTGGMPAAAAAPPLGPAVRQLGESMRATFAGFFQVPASGHASAAAPAPSAAGCGSAGRTVGPSSPFVPGHPAGPEGAAGRSPSGESSPPFSASQLQWMSDALGASVAASLTTFAGHIGQEIAEAKEAAAGARFVAEEAALLASRGKEQAADARREAASASEAAAAAATSAAETRRAVDALAARVEALSARGPAQERTVARLGNLGWDATASELEAAAVSLLTAARVDRTLYGPVAAVVGRAGGGSAVETNFRSSDDLQAARIAVRALRRELVPGRVAWLDVARTRAETQHVRVLHRLAEALEAVEEGRDDRQPVVRDIPARAVAVGGRRLAFVTAERVSWTPHGTRRYGEGDREDAAAVALAA